MLSVSACRDISASPPLELSPTRRLPSICSQVAMLMFDLKFLSSSQRNPRVVMEALRMLNSSWIVFWASESIISSH